MERGTLQDVAEGWSLREIAERRGIHVSTVWLRTKRAREKYGVPNTGPRPPRTQTGQPQLPAPRQPTTPHPRLPGRSNTRRPRQGDRERWG
ncbi:sigma factor-like helix-turn-helix DNA-binding protein [Streptomyces indicus]|uniref:sigma factor-like helix-turn-helix DNA-binding protein n=1 Tax=Streptomyces indicus TaxID=417292 RepID=UPI003CCBB140